jgi:hypothetical protein
LDFPYLHFGMALIKNYLVRPSGISSYQWMAEATGNIKTAVSTSNTPTVTGTYE